MMEMIDYEQLPDGMNREEVEHIFWIWLKESITDGPKIAINKLDYLSDVQWHTYEIPAVAVREALEDWVETYISKNSVNLSVDVWRVLLGVGYCFGFQISLYKKIFKNYAGENKNEFSRNISNSFNKEFIDPYWSIKS